jgi:hypothetical protein
MSNPHLLSFTLLTAGLLTAAGGRIDAPPTPQADPVARLNDCIQRRFLDARSFGMGRVLPYRHRGVYQFAPENTVEKEIVSELTKKGYQVALFLVGRHVLDTPVGMNARFGLQGPAYVANAIATPLPDNDSLLSEGRRAMESFIAKDDRYAGYDVHHGDWTIAIRPLRATNDSCVACHRVGPGALVRNDARNDARQAKLGDALGVAMYAYRR